MKTLLCKILRVTAIVLLGITVAFTLLGAIGSTCAAFAPERYDSMLPLAPYKWLYQLLVIISLAAGLAGIRALISLVRNAPSSYRDTLIFLLVGGGAALVQVVASRLLRGKSMPTDIRLYVTLLTLLVFLLLRIPGIWQGVGFTRGKSSPASLAGGIAAIVMGLLTLTVHLWAAPTHMLEGVNYADVWHVTLALLGWGLVLSGAGILIKRRMAKVFSRTAQAYPALISPH